MYVLLLEKHQIEMKYFCEALYIILNYIYKVTINKFINVLLIPLPISSCTCTCMYITAYICYIKFYGIFPKWC